jgi:hypothetical protein
VEAASKIRGNLTVGPWPRVKGCRARCPCRRDQHGALRADLGRDLTGVQCVSDPAANEDILHFLFARAAPSISLSFPETKEILLG